MSDRDFIELLNLYLDHEIGRDGAARLEAEVARDADRRQLYLQYCRMHKACLVMGEASLPADDKVVVLRPVRPFGAGLLYAGGLMAAAAAVAAALVLRAPAPRPAPVSAAPSLAAAKAPARAPEAAPDELRPVFSTRAFTADPSVQSASWGGSLAWMNQVRIAPIPPMPPTSPAYEGKAGEMAEAAAFPRASGATELNALQFEK